jgi:hypothetical protein
LIPFEVALFKPSDRARLSVNELRL